MKSVKVEAFVEMMKLVGYAVGGAVSALVVIRFFGVNALLTGLMTFMAALAIYSAFKLKCISIEERRSREARAAEKLNG